MIKPIVFQIQHTTDNRGYNSILYDSSINALLPDGFHVIQINQGFSTYQYTLRGLHYQLAPYSQAKLCYCLTGSVFNVAVDLLTGDITTAELMPGTAMFIPHGYAHGYLTLKKNTLFQWCVDNDYCPETARVLRYDSCGINWPVSEWNKVIISEKDRSGKIFKRQV